MAENPQSPVIIVGIADIKIGKAPSIITTNLGSCIAVCLYDKNKQVGGMLHLMLARASDGTSQEVIKIAKYADTGIPELLKKLREVYGLGKENFVAKIFGGAKILQFVSHNIGADNEIAVREILKTLGIRVVAAKTGGEKGYKVSFDLNTGKVICQIFGEPAGEF